MPVRFRITYEMGQKIGDCEYFGSEYLDDSGNRKANFRCTCGNYFVATIAKVKSGHTKSCGCLHSNGLIQRNFRHGLRSLPEYNIWLHIKRRCYNRNCQGYENWGGRGIKMCEEWKNSFQEFYKDMGSRPANCRGIDRIENSKGYYKENCRWANYIEQANNTRRNRIIDYNGKKQSLSLWSKELGFDYTKAAYHFREDKKSVEEIFNLTKNKDAK